MPADIDIGQVLIIAIAMIAAFVQWVWKLIQDGKEARERARRQQERARLGRDNSAGEASESPATPPLPVPPPSVPKGGIWDLVEALKEEMRKAQEGPVEVPAPPPIPVRPPEQRRVPTPPAPPAIPASRPTPIAASPTVAPLSAAHVSKNTVRDGAVDIRASVMNLDALKQAIILNEVLGPPKALQ